MNLCLSVVPKPDDALTHQIALLSWITPREMTDYIAKLGNQQQCQMQSDLDTEKMENALTL